MFQPWRIRLKAVEAALRAGQLEAACCSLLQQRLTEFAPGRQLAQRLAEALVARGCSAVEAGNSAGGWRDYQAAAELGAPGELLAELSNKLFAAALQEVERYLAAGDTHAALQRLDEMQRWPGAGQTVRLWVQAVEEMHRALQLVRQGELASAEAALAAAAALQPACESILRWHSKVARQHNEVRQLRTALHEALHTQRWSEALRAAEALLEIAPRDPLALAARRRIWSAVGARWADRAAEAMAGAQDARGVPRSPARPAAAAAPSGSNGHMLSGERYVLWIDGVGGYLLCLADEVVLGQAVPEAGVDVGMLADLSARHAVLRRTPSGYLLVPHRSTRVCGREATAATPLPREATIELGTKVRLQFRIPHALSHSACLDVHSGHRLQPAADGVVLMADTCVLGPAACCHVRCAAWTDDVVLFRREGQLWCRGPRGGIVIDSVAYAEAGPLRPASRVEGESFSMSLERL
jgi:tetratricopeptide (TPR) repeat protein